MKLEIELDLNKIDYDQINKQIAEKVEALNLVEVYDIESRIDNKVNSIVHDKVNNTYNSYIHDYWESPTPDGKNLVESITKTEIENRIRKVMEEVFKENYSEDTLRNIMIKILPDVLASILFGRMESALFTKEFNYQDQIHKMVKNEIEYSISKAANNIRY